MIWIVQILLFLIPPGFVANIPLCVPSSITFKKYHLDHHRYQGDNKLDVDIPSHLEGYLFYNTFTKVCFFNFDLNSILSKPPFFISLLVCSL